MQSDSGDALLPHCGGAPDTWRQSRHQFFPFPFAHDLFFAQISSPPYPRSPKMLQRKHQLLRPAQHNRPTNNQATEQQPEGEQSCSSTKLPIELIKDILELAFFSPGASSARKQDHRSRSLDVATVLNVLTTSQAFHAVALPVLYYEVHLTQPTSLALVHEALQRRPFLGQLVKRLVIGNKDKLPEGWWPGFWRGGEAKARMFDKLLWTRLRSSISSGEEAGKFAQSLKCARHFIYDAIDTAVVDMRLPCHEPNHTTRPSISTSASAAAKGDPPCFADMTVSPSLPQWLLASYKIFATLDLYALELRRNQWEAETSTMGSKACKERCKALRCGHYARLAIVEDTPERSTRSISNRFTIRRADIEAHLLRRGGLADRLDHPLPFARSGLAVWHINVSRQPELFYPMATQGLAETLGEEIEPDHTNFKGVVALIADVLKLCGDARVSILHELLEKSVKFRTKLVEEQSREEEVAKILCGMASAVRDG